MATRSSHNKNNSAIKRIMQEARELANDPSVDYSAAPLEDDIFEWHCTLRGPSGTEFEGGLYHFRIVLPSEYPFRPPSIMLLTPNGRFELNTKICISFTNYHEELWQPAWGIRTAIIGLQGFFPLKGQAAIGVGSLETPASERKRLARLSRDWVCPHCKVINLVCLPDPPAHDKQDLKDGEIQSTTHSHQSACAPISNLPFDPASSLKSKPSFSLPSDSQATTESVVSDSVIDKSIPEVAVQVTQQTPLRTGLQPESTITRSSTPIDVRSIAAARRPPFILDAAIGVLLVLVVALLCRKLY